MTGETNPATEGAGAPSINPSRPGPVSPVTKAPGKNGPVPTIVGPRPNPVHNSTVARNAVGLPLTEGVVPTGQQRLIRPKDPSTSLAGVKGTTRSLYGPAIVGGPATPSGQINGTNIRSRP
jgi:hypothetical protein